MTNRDHPTPGNTAVRVLALSHFCQVTPRWFEALLRHFKTLDGIYAAESDDFKQLDGIDDERAVELSQAAVHVDAAQVVAQTLAQRDIDLVTRFDDHYSRLLFELNDPPSLLFFRGKNPTNDQKSVAVVGSRVATAEGMELTSRLVKELAARKVQIISSLVGGIDIAAHLAAKAAGSPSYAVLDCGFDQLDREERLPVAIDIVQTGGIFSEYAPEVEANDDRLGEANRLIAGMARAVIVTEVYQDSKRVLDLLQACQDIGKLTFFMIDPKLGALADETSLAQAVSCGAIPIEGVDHIDDIVKSLI